MNTFNVGDRVRVVRDAGYYRIKPGDICTVAVVRDSPSRAVLLQVPGATGDRDHIDRLAFHKDWIELVEPKAAPAAKVETPDRVRAQHAAERLVADLFDCTRTQAREDRLLRHAYRAAYRAFRKCQKEGAP
jgi:hypothetical protein